MKAESMVCSKDTENINIKIDEETLKQILKFKYLRSIFTEDGENKKDIIQQFNEAKIILNNKKQLLCWNNLGLEIKKINL